MKLPTRVIAVTTLAAAAMVSAAPKGLTFSDVVQKTSGVVKGMLKDNAFIFGSPGKGTSNGFAITYVESSIDLQNRSTRHEIGVGAVWKETIDANGFATGASSISGPDGGKIVLTQPLKGKPTWSVVAMEVRDKNDKWEAYIETGVKKIKTELGKQLAGKEFNFGTVPDLSRVQQNSGGTSSAFGARLVRSLNAAGIKASFKDSPDDPDDRSLELNVNNAGIIRMDFDLKGKPAKITLLANEGLNSKAVATGSTALNVVLGQAKKGLLGMPRFTATPGGAALRL